MKTKNILAVAVLSLLPLVPMAAWAQSQTSPDPYSPSLGWQTHHPTLVCDSYFKVKEGEKAAVAKDDKWFRETGCRIVPGGLRLVLIDAPNFDRGGEVWRVRLYSSDNNGENLYIRYTDALNYANAGAVKDEKEAAKRFEIMEEKYKSVQRQPSKLTFKVVKDAGGTSTMLIGPASYSSLYFFCSAAVPIDVRLGGGANRSKLKCEEPSRRP